MSVRIILRMFYCDPSLVTGMNEKPISFRELVPFLFVVHKNHTLPPVISNCRGMLDEKFVGFLVLQSPLCFTISFPRVEHPHALLGQPLYCLYLFPIALVGVNRCRQELRRKDVLDHVRNVVRGGRCVHPGIVDLPEAAAEGSLFVFVLLEPVVMVHRVLILVKVVHREDISAGVFGVPFGLYLHTVGAAFEQIFNDYRGKVLATALAEIVRYFRSVSLSIEIFTV